MRIRRRSNLPAAIPALVALAGPLNRHGNFGEVREGWVADLLLFDADPFANLTILRRSAEALAVIMKGGVVVKG